MAESFSLFENDYQFVKNAFEFLNREDRFAEISFQDNNHTLSLIAPDDLRERFRFLPSEIWPENGDFILTANQDDYEAEIKRSRNDEHAWPKTHYLWRRHPVIEWLQERMLSNTGRHEALVLGLNTDLADDESVFLVSALIPNRKAHPVIWSWYAVHCKGDAIERIAPLHETLSELQLGKKPRPNTTLPVNMQHLNNLRQSVVDRVKEAVLTERKEFEQAMIPKLQEQINDLKRLRSAQEQQLELTLSRSQQSSSFKESRRHQRMKKIDDVFTEYLHWVQDTMQTEPSPYIQLIAVLAPCQQEV